LQAAATRAWIRGMARILGAEHSQAR